MTELLTWLSVNGYRININGEWYHQKIGRVTINYIIKHYNESRTVTQLS